jgi:hypothetical protein
MAGEILVAWLSLFATGRGPSGASQNLYIYCNTGYSERDCGMQRKRLGDLLTGMNLAPLGDWTWVLVRSNDWKPILRKVGRDADSPAFTILEKRQTFLEEALFTASPERSRTLLDKFRMPLDQLLPFAVAHELAHAVCHETDEAKAKAYAEQLRGTGKIICSGRK